MLRPDLLGDISMKIGRAATTEQTLSESILCQLCGR
jgi:hypothetical protein